MRLLFYDVETAQAQNIGSICAIGWVLFENDQEIDHGYQLIDPNCSFSKKNTAIHGLSSKDVQGAPSFSEYWEKTLGSLMASSIVIAHNAAFDLSATEQALFSSGINDPGISYLDSLELFRFYCNLDSYKLTNIAASIGYEYVAHNAYEDARALSQIVLYYRDNLGFCDLATMIVASPVRCENTLSNSYRPKHIETDWFSNKAHCKEEVEVINDKLSGFKICITGDLPGFTRSDIEKLILQNGGKPVSSVSSKTDFLLCCDRMDIPPEKYTSKLRTALTLSEAGCKVKIITPEKFFEMIGISI